MLHYAGILLLNASSMPVHSWKLVLTSASLITSILLVSLAAFEQDAVETQPHLGTKGINDNLRIVAMGGSSVDDYPGLATDLIRMTNKSHPSVLVICAASYDNPGAIADWMRPFVNLGCPANYLAITLNSPSSDLMQLMVDEADLVLFCWGNTQFAIDRIQKSGLGDLLRKASLQGKVMAGSSAGAIFPFDGGHSDSMDPASVKNPCHRNIEKHCYDWQYIRASGLGILPGFLCPHHDTNRTWQTYIVQAQRNFTSGELGFTFDARTLTITSVRNEVLNRPHLYLGSKIKLVDATPVSNKWDFDRAVQGLMQFSMSLDPPNNRVHRADDFVRLLHSHRGEHGIGVDQNAVLVVEGDHYRIVADESAVGSVGPHGQFVSDRTGHPGVWHYRVHPIFGVKRTLMPRSGVLSLLTAPASGEIHPDPLLPLARKQNPDDGMPPGPIEDCDPIDQFFVL